MLMSLPMLRKPGTVQGGIKIAWGDFSWVVSGFFEMTGKGVTRYRARGVTRYRARGVTGYWAIE